MASGATLEQAIEAASPDRRTATALGLGAVLLWALLAPLGVLVGEVPPFLLTGITFLIAGVAGLVQQALRGRPIRDAFATSAPAALLTIGALFGYHALYFSALRLLPPVTALLVMNLWPLLIVLMSALLPGERLRIHHVAGALLGLAGVTLVVTGRGAPDLSGSLVGYAVAVAAALVWSGYSVLNRKVGTGTSPDAMTGFCLATAALALFVAVLTEPLAMPHGTTWLGILALGLGPVGLAFFLWDHGTRHGDLRALGASAYAGPLIGTLLLLLMGRGEPSWSLPVAAVLIVGGSLLASGELLTRRRAASRDG